MQSEEEPSVVDEDKADTTIDVEEEITVFNQNNYSSARDDGLDTFRIGLYAGSLVLAIGLIIAGVICCNKICKKKKDLMEVEVEMKPVDLDQHFKGVEERSRLKLIQRARG